LGRKRDSLSGAGQGIGKAVALAFAREGGVTFTTRTVIVVGGGQTP
jgi:hypothetical protein